MAERRSLTTVLNSPIPEVDPEILRSFVTQRSSTESDNAQSVTESTEYRRLENSTTQHSSSATSSVATSLKRTSRFKPVGLIPITVRLRPEIAGGLKQVSLERELEGEEIFTQQDIVEEALESWLNSNGYLL